MSALLWEIVILYSGNKDYSKKIIGGAVDVVVNAADV